jgi:putative ABC transport system ATP-binding protein
VIELENVSHTYRRGENEVRALAGVSLRVEQGEFLLIKGPSGSGKTTLLNLIAGLDRPSSGRVLFEGDDLTGLSDAAMSRMRNRRVGYVFQAFYLEGAQTAAANVKLPLIFGGVPRRERRERAIEMLGRVGLAEKANERAGNLSAGQKQRVALARAIVNRPHVILADEPTANLDPRTGREILALLERIHREDRTTVLLVSHEKDLDIPYARHLWIEDGNLREDTARAGVSS